MLYMPLSGVEMAWWPLLVIGFSVGVVGGYFGLGGAWLVTPALNIFGFPMVYAVATDMAHVAGKSIVSSFRHWKFGHVSAAIAVFMLIGTFSGVEVGAQCLMWLNKKGLAGPVVRYIYMAILLGMFYLMLKDYLSARKVEKETGQAVKDIVGNKLSKWINETLKEIPPVFHCKVTRMRLSLWSCVFVGIVCGFVAGILGIGGGLLRVPALIYILGLPTKVAVGTDLFEVMFSGAYGGFTYGVKGKVELIAACIMLTGAAVGAQFGTVCTKYVHGIIIRLVYAIACLFAFSSVVLKQVAWFYTQSYDKAVKALLKADGITGDKASIITGSITPGGKEKMHHYIMEVAKKPEWWADYQMNILYTNIGGVVVLLGACGLTACILYMLFQGIAKERREIREAQSKAAGV
ncbi:MAG: sulfite exporter TauE/SafE family protein [Actinobacteria bacterium]|nr:sulfite exporter TauE/SafE family protein [Actinomycetota bacterium]